MITRCLAVCVLLAVPATSIAQQDLSAVYDISQTVTLTGFVSKVDWADSQVSIRLNVRNLDRTEAWTLEAGSAAELAQKGWTRDALKIGTEIKITANPARPDSRVPGAARKGYVTRIEQAGPPPKLIADQFTKNQR
jgi:hypothetical protein